MMTSISRRMLVAGIGLLLVGLAVALTGVQLAYAQQPVVATVDPVSNVTALVLAVGGVIGAVGAIIAAFAGMLRAKFGDKVVSNELMEKISTVTESLKATDHWILENEERLKTVASVVTTLSPEAKTALEEQGVNIAALTTELEKTEAELGRLHAALPKAPAGLPPT